MMDLDLFWTYHHHVITAEDQIKFIFFSTVQLFGWWPQRYVDKLVTNIVCLPCAAA